MRKELAGRLARWTRRAPAFRGRARVVRWLQRALVGDGEVEAEVEGVRFVLDLGELIQHRLFWDGAHDGHVLGWLEREARARAAGVVWDVGANVGAVSLLLARRVPGVVIESFEPAPAVFAKLARNVALNPRLNVTARPLAVSDHEGWVDFFASAERGNAGIGSLGAAANTVGEATRVEAVSGDAYVARGGLAPDVIKIDVEGFEPEVLAGLGETLKGRGPSLCVESSAYRLRARGFAIDHIVSILEHLDFRVNVIDGARERPLKAGDLAGNVDLAARPRG